jgi:hypothetical protein
LFIVKTEEIVKAVLEAGINPSKVLVRQSNGAYGALVPSWVSSERLREPTASDIIILRHFGVDAATRSFAQATVGAIETSFATVFEGWNVWGVWQTKELPFSLMMIGVSRDRQLKIWVEDEIRLNAPGAKVADPLDLKGGQIQILNGPPTLKEAQTKEQVSGPGMVLESQDQPPELRFIRFFNRGSKAVLPWPHDDNYLLDRVYQPDPANPATNGSGPGTITERNVLDPAGEAGKDILVAALAVTAVGLAGYAAFLALSGKAIRKLR